VVTAIHDPSTKLGNRRFRSVKGHGRRLRDRVRIHLENPSAPTQNSLNEPFLAGEVQALDLQDGLRPAPIADMCGMGLRVAGPITVFVRFVLARSHPGVLPP
jgi:hypothetical protein